MSFNCSVSRLDRQYMFSRLDDFKVDVNLRCGEYDRTVVGLVFLHLLLWRWPKETQEDMYGSIYMQWKPFGGGPMQHTDVPM